MKKIIAFLTALILFLITAVGLDRNDINNFTLNNNAFSTWINEVKFHSPDAMKQNINKDTLVVFGSSELAHGQKTIYHPKTMFQGFAFNPMLIGSGYYQCLNHAITLAAIGDSIPNKKVVLLVSPSWFRRNGVENEAFASRFSEVSYLDMLENKSLTDDTKQYIKKRSESLLDTDPKMLHKVQLYDRVMLHENPTLIDCINYPIYTAFLRETMHQTILSEIELEGLKKNQNKNNKNTPIDWDAYFLRAETEGIQKNTNPFYMSPRCYKQIIPKLQLKKGQQKNIADVYTVSPEYDDFNCFLDVCKELDIKPYIIALPVNGYWYDYTGFPPSTRTKYYNNIREICESHGARYTDLSKNEFTKYFFQDGIHLGKKGWVTINELLYQYYKENKDN
ncbi:MAG: D-alanyl-lipoteichoic acid biosynthesis protein DltD [Lachnospiraceae bacterium]